MLSEITRDTIGFAAREIIKCEGGIESCLARNTPASFLEIGIANAARNGHSAFVAEVRENREEAEQIIAGIWGLM